MSSLLRAYRQAYAGLPCEAWMLAGVMFVNRCGSMALPFLALYLCDERGYAPAAAGRMLAVYGCGAIVGSYFGGRLTERWGGTAVAVGGLALGAPAFALLPACSSTGALVAALLYLSVAYESIRPALSTATSDFSPPEMHPKAFALNRLALNLGMSVGPVVGGLLATWDYRLLFWINGAFAAATAAALARAFGPGVARAPAARSSAAAGRSPWRDKPFLLFLLLQVFAAIVFFQLCGAMALYWKQQWGISEFGIGGLFVVNTLMIVAIEMVITDRLQGRSPLRLVAIGTGLVCLGFGGTVFGQGMASAVVLTVIWTLGEILSAPFSMAFVAGRAGGRSRGAYMGLNATSFAVAFVAAPLVGATLYEFDPQLPWLACLALAAVLPCGLWWLATVCEREEAPDAPAFGGPAPRTGDQREAGRPLTADLVTPRDSEQVHA